MSAALLPAWSLPNFCRTAKGKPSTPWSLLERVDAADKDLHPARSTGGPHLPGIEALYLRASRRMFRNGHGR